MNEYIRSVRLRHHFKDSTTCPKFPKLVLKSNCIPPTGPGWIEEPLRGIRHQLAALHLNNRLKYSCQFELKTLLSLHNKSGVRILPTDKNLGPAIVSDTWYVQEVERLLKDTKFYRKVDTIPFCKMGETLTTILMRCGKNLPDKIISYITQYVDCPNQEPAHFKIFPKVHKTSMVGRPIVASTKYFTTPASQFVDSVLSPYIPCLKSALKDSTELVKTLSEMIVDPECFLVTADTSSLYTNLVPRSPSVQCYSLCFFRSMFPLHH